MMYPGYDALAAGDAALAQAAALMRVNTTETWLRRHLAHVAAAVPDVLDDRGDDTEPLSDEAPVLP
ncbi:hypothetical protein [Actinospica robiniae]|uniref:hypothetical protein n=1 Tax=Actinospica robiniae TaxID=304901 RepID=UPI0003FBAEB9|nr:hypothetical protein [Actinospica robiniae]